MAHHYPQHTFTPYSNSQWNAGVRTSFDEADISHSNDQSFERHVPHSMAETRPSRRSSTVKIEEDFTVHPGMWHDHTHANNAPMQRFPTPTVPLVNPPPPHMMRMHSQPYAQTMVQPSAWSMPLHSQSNTPTPIYGFAHDHIPVQFNSTSGTFPFQHDPTSAVAMSPQSSHGGWCSTMSDDSGGQKQEVNSPKFRAMSPMTVQRSDGIRKKNARFDIPNHVNLHNVEDLIRTATDETIKKELKQQKRLLRNRQAALDSRQRKKNHADQLEKDKEVWMTEQKDLTDKVAHLENALTQERDVLLQQQQHYESFIQGLQYERDEAIRTKTIETADLRRQNTFLKDCVRDLERQQASRSISTPQDTFHADFHGFDSLDLGEEGWENDFSLIDNSEFRMDDEDSPQRQLTPKPPAAPPVPALVPTSQSSKPESGFSWNTFYMCLLFGAFFASQSSSKGPPAGLTDDKTHPTSTLSSLSEEYRVEAGNVLKAVLATDGDHNADRPSSSSMAPPTSSRSATLPPSSLHTLSTQLTTPTRQQQGAAAFALTPSQYEHITNPEGLGNNHNYRARSSSPAREDFKHPRPTPLQAMFSSMQAERDDVERAMGLGSKARERSVILDRVPEKVLRDFRRLVAESEGRKGEDA